MCNDLKDLSCLQNFSELLFPSEVLAVKKMPPILLICLKSTDVIKLFGFFLFWSSSNKMSSTTTGRSRLLRAERRRRGERDRRENPRAAMMEVRAKRTRKLSWTRWKSCPKTASQMPERTPTVPAWRREEVRMRRVFLDEACSAASSE